MKKFIYLLMSLCLSALIWSCGSNESGGEKESTIAPKKASAVSVVEVEYHEVISAYGQIKKSEDYFLSFLTDGKIDYINVSKGSRIRVGQKLGELKYSHLESDFDKVSLAQQQNQVAIAELNSRLEDAQKRLAENESLHADSLISMDMVTQSRLEVKSLKSEIERSTLNIDVSDKNRAKLAYHRSRHILQSPVSGTVQKVLHKKGENVAAGTPVLIITPDQSSVTFEAAVSDKEIVQLGLFESVIVTLDAYSDKEFTGEISFINETPAPSSGQYLIEASLVSSDEKVVPGLFGTIKVKSDEAKKYNAIPLSALVKAEENDAKVLQVIKNKAYEKDVKIYKIHDDKVLIKEGLEEGSEILTDVNGLIEHGDTLNIIR